MLLWAHTGHGSPAVRGSEPAPTVTLSFSLCRFMQHPKNFGLIASFLDRKVSLCLPGCNLSCAASPPIAWLLVLELQEVLAHLWVVVVVLQAPGRVRAPPGSCRGRAESAAGGWSRERCERSQPGVWAASPPRDLPACLGSCLPASPRGILHQPGCHTGGGHPAAQHGAEGSLCSGRERFLRVD